jgi:hypothetical protein
MRGARYDGWRSRCPARARPGPAARRAAKQAPGARPLSTPPPRPRPSPSRAQIYPLFEYFENWCQVRGGRGAGAGSGPGPGRPPAARRGAGPPASRAGAARRPAAPRTPSLQNHSLNCPPPPLPPRALPGREPPRRLPRGGAQGAPRAAERLGRQAVVPLLLPLRLHHHVSPGRGGGAHARGRPLSRVLARGPAGPRRAADCLTLFDPV